MKKDQAEAVANAILEPGLKAQDELRHKREMEERRRTLSRFTAAFALVGFAVGAAVAHFTGGRFTIGGLWGAICGAAIGQFVGAWRARRRAA